MAATAAEIESFFGEVDKLERRDHGGDKSKERHTL
jgi:hypothetical protein